MIRERANPVTLEEQREDRDALMTPFIRLWGAVLYQGILDYSKYLRGDKGDECRDAYRWIHSDEFSTGSYLWCCELLTICPVRMLRKCNTNFLDIATHKIRSADYLPRKEDDGDL